MKLVNNTTKEVVVEKNERGAITKIDGKSMFMADDLGLTLILGALHKYPFMGPLYAEDDEPIGIALEVDDKAQEIAKMWEILLDHGPTNASISQQVAHFLLHMLSPSDQALFLKTSKEHSAWAASLAVKRQNS